MIRKTPGNVRKLKKVADELGATILRPYYPASDLYRLENDDSGLQLDFMSLIHGIRSFKSLQPRATTVDMGGAPLRVAALADIIKSKRAAGRPRDVAVLPLLEATLEESSKTGK